jgi:hypothetical protein
MEKLDLRKAATIAFGVGGHGGGPSLQGIWYSCPACSCFSLQAKSFASSSSTSGQVVCIKLLKAFNLSAGLLDQILFFITWILNDEIMLLRTENYRRACHEVVITSWPAPLRRGLVQHAV